MPWNCETNNKGFIFISILIYTADCKLLHLADYGIMPPGQGTHEGRKAPVLMGVREGTDAMVTRPQHVLYMSYEADLCRLGCQQCIRPFSGISNSTPLFFLPKLEARVFLAKVIQLKSHILSFIINWWVGSEGEICCKESSHIFFAIVQSV